MSKVFQKPASFYETFERKTGPAKTGPAEKTGPDDDQPPA